MARNTRGIRKPVSAQTETTEVMDHPEAETNRANVVQFEDNATKPEAQPDVEREEIGIILTNKGKVKAQNKRIATMYAELSDKLLSQTASVMWHAAKHGDTALLNNFFNVIPESQQQSFVEWTVRAVSGPYPNGHDTKPSALWLGKSKEKGFFVRQGTMDERNKFIVVCEDNAQNNISAFNWAKKKAEKLVDPFSDEDIAKKLYAILIKATGDKSAASPAQVEALKKAIAAFDLAATVTTKDATEKKAA